MKYVFALTALVVLLAIPSMSMGAGCSANHYETVCKEDSSCEWDTKKSKCKKKEANTGCSSHSEFYCEANGCQWDRMASKCNTKATGK
jgi:hypothetical protein